MSYLHIDSVVKYYKSRKILRNIYLSCSTGDIIGLLGSNGSGKSTLLKIVFGVLNSESKFVKIDDKILKDVYGRRNLINYLPQDSFLPKNIKVARLIGLFCDKEGRDQLLKNDIIKPFLPKKSNSLSGGEKRLVEVFMLLHTKAKFILLDEPFNGISPIYRNHIKMMIQEKSKTKGFIITDHDYRNILDVSNRIEFLHEGRLQEIEQLQDLVKLGYLNKVH